MGWTRRRYSGSWYDRGWLELLPPVKESCGVVYACPGLPCGELNAGGDMDRREAAELSSPTTTTTE